MKKILTIIIATSLIFVFTACGKSGTQSESQMNTFSDDSKVESVDTSSETKGNNSVLSAVSDDLSVNTSESGKTTEEPKIIDLITCSPYGQPIEDEALSKELKPVVEKILESEFVIMGETPLYDTKNIIEYVNSDYSYYSVLPELATTKEELLYYFKKIYTDTYSSSIKLEDSLFSDSEQLYKMIDGKLCICAGYYGVPPRYDINSLKILNKENNKVNVLVEGSGIVVGDNYYKTMTLLYSDEYGWRLNENNVKPYYAEEQYFYHLFVGNADKINKILSGSENVLNNGLKVFIQKNGIFYVKIEKFMSIDDMKKYFRKIFTTDLANTYISNYIQNVYLEENGDLYRSVNAKKGKMYEYQPDFFTWNGSGDYNLERMNLLSERNWKNPVTGSVSAFETGIEYNYIGDIPDGPYKTYNLTSLKISTSLPLYEVE